MHISLREGSVVNVTHVRLLLFSVRGMTGVFPSLSLYSTDFEGTFSMKHVVKNKLKTPTEKEVDLVFVSLSIDVLL